MIDCDTLELQQMRTPTEQEMLQEAKAWGCSSIDEFVALMDEIHAQEIHDV